MDELEIVGEMFNVTYSNIKGKQYAPISNIHINGLGKSLVDLFYKNKNIFHIVITTADVKSL